MTQLIESKPIDEAVARAVARDCAAKMQDALLVATLNKAELPFTTLIEATIIGALTIRALAAFFDSSKHTSYLDELETLLKTFEFGQMNQSAMEQLLFERLISGVMTPEMVREGIDFCIQTLTSVTHQQRLMHTVVEEMYGPREPGKAGKIEYDQLSQLASLSASLVAPAELLLRVRDVFPKSSSLGIVQKLADEYPDEAALLAQYLGPLDRALQEREFAALKTDKAKASYLADVMAGARWELSPSYARQKAEEARRLLKRSKLQE